MPPIASRRPAVLIVDDDPIIYKLIGHVLSKQDMDCTVAEYISSARECLREKTPDLCIIDGQLPDGLGIDLCREIKSSPNPPAIIFFSAYFDDAFSFRELRGDIGVDLVLHKPLDPWILAMHAVAVLERPGRQSPEGVTDEVLKKYDESIFLKLIDIERLIWGLSQNMNNPAPRRSLRAMLHNIKGSAGFYGYPYAGDVAGKMERLLGEIETSNQPVTKDLALSLRRSFQHLKSTFQYAQAVPARAGRKTGVWRKSDALIDVLLVAADWDFLNVMQHAAREFPLRLHAYENPFRAMEAVVNGILAPSAAVLDNHFPGEMDGADLAASLRDAVDSHSMMTFFVGEGDGAASDRLGAIRAGAERIYIKPANPQLILSDILSLLTQAASSESSPPADELTGLPPRPAFESELDSWTAPSSPPFVMARISLDGMSDVRLHYGDAVADMLLKSAGRILSRSFRMRDRTARWGLEEFAVGLRDIHKEDGVQLLSDILEKFRQIRLKEAPEFRPGFSAVVSRFPDDGQTRQDLIRAVDEGLARVKQAGGNRVAEAGSSGGPPGAIDVLLVDDDPDMLMVLEYCLKSHGYAHKSFSAGESLLEHLKEHGDSAGLILLDVDLPGISGFQVLKELPAILRRPVPIIMLTGHATESDQVRGLELGAADYMTKPFSIPILVQKIRHYLTRPIAQKTAS